MTDNKKRFTPVFYNIKGIASWLLPISSEFFLYSTEDKVLSIQIDIIRFLGVILRVQFERLLGTYIYVRAVFWKRYAASGNATFWQK